jgi:hypothetical protein
MQVLAGAINLIRNGVTIAGFRHGSGSRDRSRELGEGWIRKKFSLVRALGVLEAAVTGRRLGEVRRPRLEIDRALLPR